MDQCGQPNTNVFVNGSGTQSATQTAVVQSALTTNVNFYVDVPPPS
jgi:hypothetical protein